jgi:hypothetical protein
VNDTVLKLILIHGNDAKVSYLRQMTAKLINKDLYDKLTAENQATVKALLEKISKPDEGDTTLQDVHRQALDSIADILAS